MYSLRLTTCRYMRVNSAIHLRHKSIAPTAAMSTISEAIAKDHRELEQYYNEIINSSSRDHQGRFGNQFTWELARHSVGEELIVYPAFEKYLGTKGKEMAESDRNEHHQVHILARRG